MYSARQYTCFLSLKDGVIVGHIHFCVTTVLPAMELELCNTHWYSINSLLLMHLKTVCNNIVGPTCLILEQHETPSVIGNVVVASKALDFYMLSFCWLFF